MRPTRLLARTAVLACAAAVAATGTLATAHAGTVTTARTEHTTAADSVRAEPAPQRNTISLANSTSRNLTLHKAIASGIGSRWTQETFKEIPPGRNTRAVATGGLGLRIAVIYKIDGTDKYVVINLRNSEPIGISGDGEVTTDPGGRGIVALAAVANEKFTIKCDRSLENSEAYMLCTLSDN